MESIQNGYLGAYMESNLLLVRTMVVKLDEAASLFNEAIVTRYGLDAVNTLYPKTWKYYMNVAGQYHPTDTMMRVASMDTLELIEFTKENLEIHTATQKAYQFGSRHYYSLLNQYPTQELLINGVLNPIDIDLAIKSENGTILGYPRGLVEDNETSLVSELESFIKSQIHRWFNMQFIMSDNLFCSVIFTTLHAFVLPKLLNLRLKRCKTNEVHSFHVRMYLASHFELDRYLPYLTQKQALWLYRNIRYIERNPGKAKTLFKLIQEILTSRGVPIGEYSVRHLDAFNPDYTPEQIARIKLINSDQNTLSSDTHSVEALFDKELNKASGNSAYLSAFRDRDLERLRTSPSAIIQTKVLHSSMVDYGGSVPEPFEEVALREWCHLSMMGYYEVSVSFKDPKTSETHTLFAKDAFAYMQYLALNAAGLTLVAFPDYLNMQQRRHPKPTVDELLSLVDYKVRDLVSIAKRLIVGQPVIQPLYSVTAFRELAGVLTDEAYYHWLLISSIEDHFERALVDNMVRRLYEDERTTFSLTTLNVAEWLLARNLPSYNRTNADAESLIQLIFEAATGYTVDSTRMLKNIQRSLIDLMTELSSYTVQFTREINEERIINVAWPAVRFGNQSASQSDYRYADNGVLSSSSSEYAASSCQIGIGTNTVFETKPSNTSLSKAISIDPSTTQVATLRLIDTVDLVGPPTEMVITYPGQDMELEIKTQLPGYTTFDRLPESARMLLKSIY